MLKNRVKTLLHISRVLRNTTRAWSDKHVASHLAFVPALLLWQICEPLIFIVPLLVLSIWWHRAEEPDNWLAQVEVGCAYLLFAYGCGQLVYAPSVVLCCLSVLWAGLVVAVHVGINCGDWEWDRYHFYQHVVPGVWASQVTIYHDAIIFT